MRVKKKLKGREEYLNALTLHGALGRSRTADLLVRSQLLYPAELRARGGRNIPTDGGSVNPLPTAPTGVLNYR